MEIWRSVTGWEGFYEVSTEGRIRSVDRRHPLINRFGDTEMRLHRGKMLKPGIAKNGYAVLSFTRPGGVREYVYVHRVVAAAFLGPCPAGCEVCHEDGARANNRVLNLRYDSRSANALDRHKHGTMNQARGEAHYFSKLTVDVVREIRASPLGDREIGRRLGLAHKTVSAARRGATWAHVV